MDKQTYKKSYFSTEKCYLKPKGQFEREKPRSSHTLIMTALPTDLQTFLQINRRDPSSDIYVYNTSRKFTVRLYLAITTEYI